jgi:hypothetical protein
MADEASCEPARDPQDLERLLVSRERMGDIDGKVALYEPHAVLDCGAGRLAVGREAIRAFLAALGHRPGSLPVSTWNEAPQLALLMAFQVVPVA